MGIMVSLSDSQLGCEEYAALCSHCEAVNAICAVWLSEQLELKHRAICSFSWQQAWRVAAHFCWEEASHWHQWKVRKVLFSHLYNKFFWIFFWHRLRASEIFFFFGLWSVCGRKEMETWLHWPSFFISYLVLGETHQSDTIVLHFPCFDHLAMLL